MSSVPWVFLLGDRYWEPSSFIWIKQSNQHPFTMTPTTVISYQLANEMHQISCPPLCRFIVLGIPQRSSLWSLFYGNISLVCHLHAYLVTHWNCAHMKSNEASFFCWWRNALYCLFCIKTISNEGSSYSVDFFTLRNTILILEPFFWIMWYGYPPNSLIRMRGPQTGERDWHALHQVLMTLPSSAVHSTLGSRLFHNEAREATK